MTLDANPDCRYKLSQQGRLQASLMFFNGGSCRRGITAPTEAGYWKATNSLKPSCECDWIIMGPGHPSVPSVQESPNAGNSEVSPQNDSEITPRKRSYTNQQCPTAYAQNAVKPVGWVSDRKQSAGPTSKKTGRQPLALEYMPPSCRLSALRVQW